MVNVGSWGRLTHDGHAVVALVDRIRVAATVATGRGPGLAHGMGRSYGDVCLNPGGTLWTTPGLDRFIAFDETTGRLVCDAGVLLRDVQDLAIPRGWMLPVTPGTQLVTVGGAIANDVHGKNHHRFGSFGDHVRRLELVRTDGTAMTCGPEANAPWFAATVGGLGLTGVIVEAELQLRRVAGPWLETETVPFGRLDDFFRLAAESEAGWEHTVAWIDCLAGGGRGLFKRANPADRGDRPEPAAKRRTMPFVPPVSLVNRLSLRPFNTAYYRLGKWNAGRRLAHYRKFFYPLDDILEWNRMYGPRGFYQYQCVVPRTAGPAAIAELLAQITRAGAGSFLAVLKTFGDRTSPGLLGFPRPGVTLALDFPNDGEATHRLFERLDAVVAAAGGAIYPAKDARMPRPLFESGYPRLGEFVPFRDPGISSALSRRLMGS